MLKSLDALQPFVLRAFGRVVEGVCSRTRGCPTQALAFGVSDEGSEWPAVSQAPGTDAQFTVTWDRCSQPLLGWPRRRRVHPPELGDPGASRLEVIKGCWAQDRTAGRTSSEKVTSTHDSDEFAGRLWSVLT